MDGDSTNFVKINAFKKKLNAFRKIKQLTHTAMKKIISLLAIVIGLNTIDVLASNSLPKTQNNAGTTQPSITPRSTALLQPAATTSKASVSVNPTSNGGGTITVVNNNSPITISIADLNGKNVYEKTITENSFDLAGTMTNTGIYIISIKQNDVVISSKTWIVTK